MTIHDLIAKLNANGGKEVFMETATEIISDNCDNPDLIQWLYKMIQSGDGQLTSVISQMNSIQVSQFEDLLRSIAHVALASMIGYQDAVDEVESDENSHGGGCIGVMDEPLGHPDDVDDSAPSVAELNRMYGFTD